MATVITRALYANIGGGGSRQLTSLYNNIGGTRKSTSSAYANVNAVQKQIFPYNASTVYVWNKYTISTSSSGYTSSYKTYNSGSISIPHGTCYKCSNTIPSINSSNGTFSFTGTGQISYISYDDDFPYKYVGFKYGISYSNFSQNSQEKNHGYTNYYYCDSGTTLYLKVKDNKLYAYNNKLVREYYTTSSTTQSAGSYIGQVTSTNYYAYPTNAIQNGYWYIMQ